MGTLECLDERIKILETTSISGSMKKAIISDLANLFARVDKLERGDKTSVDAKIIGSQHVIIEKQQKEIEDLKIKLERIQASREEKYEHIREISRIIDATRDELKLVRGLLQEARYALDDITTAVLTNNRPEANFSVHRSTRTMAAIDDFFAKDKNG